MDKNKRIKRFLEVARQGEERENKEYAQPKCNFIKDKIPEEPFEVSCRKLGDVKLKTCQNCNYNPANPYARFAPARNRIV